MKQSYLVRGLGSLDVEDASFGGRNHPHGTRGHVISPWTESHLVPTLWSQDGPGHLEPRCRSWR